MLIVSRKLGALLRHPASRPRASRDDDSLLFGTEANAVRLREALADSRANRNMIPFTVEELRRQFDRGEE